MLRGSPRRKWLVILVAAGLVAAGLVYAAGDRVTGVPGRTTNSQRTQIDQPTVEVRLDTIVQTITASGNVEPARQVDLRFSGSGRIQEIRAEKGQRVDAGEILAVLDNRQQELALLKARNAYEMARIDAPPNVLRERRIDLDLAEDNLEQTRLRAPFPGVVTDVRTEAGASVGSNDVVVQMIDDSAFQVRVQIDELDIAQVSRGRQALIRLDADPGQVREGAVDDISLTANVQSGVVTIPVTVRFTETDPALRSGYTATVQIVVAEARDVPVVPVEAISEQGGVRTVTRMVNGQPTPAQVETGLSDGVWVEIRSGLEPGEQVVALNYLGGLGDAAGQRTPSQAEQMRMFRQIPGGGGVALPPNRP